VPHLTLQRLSGVGTLHYLRHGQAANADRIPCELAASPSPSAGAPPGVTQAYPTAHFVCPRLFAG
jgi:hypothetical protein